LVRYLYSVPWSVGCENYQHKLKSLVVNNKKEGFQKTLSPTSDEHSKEEIFKYSVNGRDVLFPDLKCNTHREKELELLNFEL